MSSKPEPESLDDLAEANIQAALREQAGKLDLIGLGLTSLPESLGKLTSLQSLYLSGNQLTSLPESLGKLTSLQSLYLSGNQLTSLPESLGKLTSLQSLDLSGNQLTSLPESLGKLTSLQALYLSGNQFTSLPESLGKLTSLQALDLSRNQLTSLPVWLGKLTSLQALYLSGNQLTSLPESLGKLTSLQSLDLSGNQLTSLPESLGKLTSLQSLYLSGNQLTSLPVWLGKLTSLQALDLSGNQLTSLPESLGKLTSLQALSLSGNQLTSLPESLGKLRELPALKQLFLHENPALGLPVEVLGPTFNEVLGFERKKSADPAAILDYYFRIHPPERKGIVEGQVLRELKVILVGRGGVGKTSLVEVLQGRAFVDGRRPTEGIAITRWPLTLPDGAATALVWDFGGQEIMHGTHQFFLTRRSLYLVVVDGREDRAKQDAEYWLKLVRAFGGESTALVVLNKQGVLAFDTDREDLAKKYGVAREHFFRTDCADGTGVGKLREAIEDVAARMLTPRELFPTEWWKVKQRLGKMKENKEDYLSNESYENLCKEYGVGGDDAKILLRRLTDLGTVVSFPDDLRLRELTVLSAEWVTAGIYNVLNDNNLKEKRNGQLAWGELTRVLPAERWPENRHRYLLDLMRKFELCFPLKGERETELVPELLPDKRPPLDDWNPAESLVFLYQYPVLPHGVIPRFITRTYAKNRGRERWLSGVVLAREEAEAVVRADYDKNQVIVWVRGPYADARRALLTVVRDNFATIHGRIEGLNPQELVTVKGHPEVTVPFDDLLKDEREGVRTTRVTVDGKRIDVAIAELLNGVESLEDRAKRAKEEERLGGMKTIIGTHQPTLGMPLHLRVFLSSPGDVANERRIAREVIAALAGQPLLKGQVTFEVITYDDPDAPAPMSATETPQASVNRYTGRPADCDLTIVILWSKLGTPLPADVKREDDTRYESGTVWEMEDARQAGKEIWIYRRADEPTIRLKDPEFTKKRAAYEAVEEFFQRFTNSDGSLASGFNTYSDDAFGGTLKKHLEAFVRARLESHVGGKVAKVKISTK